MNKEITLGEILGILAIASASIFFYYQFRNSTNKPLDSSEYDTLLIRSSRERQYLLDSINTLDSLNKLYILEHNKLEQEVKNLKGKYKKFTPTELELELERRANGR